MTKNIKTWIFLKSLELEILVYNNKKRKSHRRLLSEDMVKSFTVGVYEKNKSMNNEDVTLDDLLIFHSLPFLAMLMGEALQSALCWWLLPLETVMA